MRTIVLSLFLAITPPMFATNLDTELASIVNNPAYPLASLSVLTVRNGQVVYQKQFGQRYIDNTNLAHSKPANESTLYRVASISKLVTTLGVLKLVEDDKLALDTDVSVYLGYRLRNPYFSDEPITLRMLLTHTSSLRDDAGYYWEAKLNVDLQDVLLVEGKYYGKGAMWASNAKPGDYFHYANLPWGVIATIMEKVSGERFDRLMKRLLLDPMQLRGGFHPADFSSWELDNLATLYRKRTEKDGQEIWDPSGPWVAQVDDYSNHAPIPRADRDYRIGSNGTLFAPQGGLRISAADLGKIMLMLMNDGKHGDKLILKKETLAMMFNRAWQYDGKNGNNSYGNRKAFFNAWGLGNQQFLDLTGEKSGDRLIEDGGFTGVGHQGDAWGLRGTLVFDREKKHGMIFLSSGPGFNPETYRGQYSSRYRFEELILTALYRYAILKAK